MFFNIKKKQMLNWQIFENSFDEILINNNYVIENNRDYEFRCGFTGRKHKPDKIIKHKNESLIILSKKYQKVSGTADEKLFYEIAKLSDLLFNYKKIEKCYIVLGGIGFDTILGRYYLTNNWKRFFNKEMVENILIVNEIKLTELILTKSL